MSFCSVRSLLLHFSGNQKIDAGQPVYRLVTDEEWTVTVRLTSDLAQTFQKKMNGEDSLSVEVRFLKDNKDLCLQQNTVPFICIQGNFFIAVLIRLCLELGRRNRGAFGRWL